MCLLSLYLKIYERIGEKLVLNILRFAVFKEAASMQFSVFELPPRVRREMTTVHMNVPGSFDLMRRSCNTT